MARFLAVIAYTATVSAPVVAGLGLLHPNTLAGSLARFVFSLA